MPVSIRQVHLFPFVFLQTNLKNFTNLFSMGLGMLRRR